MVLAERCALLSAEVLKSQGKYSDAATLLIKMTSEVGTPPGQGGPGGAAPSAAHKHTFCIGRASVVDVGRCVDPVYIAGQTRGCGS